MKKIVMQKNILFQKDFKDFKNNICIKYKQNNFFNSFSIKY